MEDGAQLRYVRLNRGQWPSDELGARFAELQRQVGDSLVDDLVGGDRTRLRLADGRVAEQALDRILQPMG